MLIEKGGVTPSLKFKDLAQGEAFYAKNSTKETLMLKGFQFQGVGQCGINLENGAVCVIDRDVEVVRVPAKVVIE